MENKQYSPRWEVDFSNPNANNITTGTTTGKPMENKQQTAVEWLMDHLEDFGDPQICKIKWKDLDLLIQQAKAMEKQDMIDLLKWRESMFTKEAPFEYVLSEFEKYYNQTFKNQ